MRVKILLNYQLKNEVSQANFNTYKRIYNWQPFMKRVYRSPTSVLSNSLPLQCPGGLVPEKLGGGVWPASQNPYPTYDQNLRYSIPYLWPGQKFETLFMTWLKHKLWRAFVDFLFDNDEKSGFFLKTYPDQGWSAKTIPYLWPR